MGPTYEYASDLVRRMEEEGLIAQEADFPKYSRPCLSEHG